MVHRVGDLIADRKFEFAAWQTLEAGKNFAEAEADVAEAIDFCRYYALQAIEMARPLPVHEYTGETNESWLQPIGVGAIIPPWNFPLAILVGMTIGPVAAGNTVVLKPASNTPLIGWGFMQVLQEAGLPPGVVNFLPGSGRETGIADQSGRLAALGGGKVGDACNLLAIGVGNGDIARRHERLAVVAAAATATGGGNQRDCK